MANKVSKKDEKLIEKYGHIEVKDTDFKKAIQKVLNANPQHFPKPKAKKKP